MMWSLKQIKKITSWVSTAVHLGTIQPASFIIHLLYFATVVDILLIICQSIWFTS